MHSLAFRVMRLCQPDLPAEHVFGLDMSRDFYPDDLASHAPPLCEQVCGCSEQHGDNLCMSLETLMGIFCAAPQTGSQVFASRAHTQGPANGVGTHGFLELPQNFGSIYLGENFASYISVGNYASQAVRNVVIKVPSCPPHGHCEVPRCLTLCDGSHLCLSAGRAAKWQDQNATI